jgi:hypothetical protein
MRCIKGLYNIPRTKYLTADQVSKIMKEEW